MLLRLADKILVFNDVTTFVWEPSEPIHWQAGQFLRYILPHDNPDDRGTARWFTIAAPPYEGQPRITTRFAPEHSSSFKTALRTLEIGATIEATRPSGDFTISDPGRPFVFIAGGIGITPYYAILLQLDHEGIDIHGKLLYANRTDDYVFKSEIEALAARHPHFSVSYFTDPAHIGVVDIQQASQELSQPMFYLSGPEPMVGHYKDQMTAEGFAEADIKTDYFPGYN